MRRLLALLGVLLVATAARPAAAALAVQARLSSSAAAVGDAVTLEVVVSGASGEVAEPEIALPRALDLVANGHTQSFAWVNGRTSSSVTFQYAILPRAAGSYSIGPVRVRAGREIATAAALALTVGGAPARVRVGGTDAAALRVDVEPARPYVGQPVLLRVRMLLRDQLAETPDYDPPATPGFWSESPSPPETYYAAQSGGRVQVTEARTRLYPLAAGAATVGEATAVLTLDLPGADDPLAWAGGRVPQREVTVRSQPVRVDVRPLPPGAPPGFDGAVGTLRLSWTADRARTPRDVPVTVRLDLRGEGNLPLIHTPTLGGAEVEVFQGTVDDSLAPPGTLAAGRRRFQWTVLPRREGTVTIAAPPFAWFDPASGEYRRVALAPIVLQVDPPTRGSSPSGAFPDVFADHPLDPYARPAAPWGGALAGLALGAALALWRAAARPAPDGAERARQREWLRAVGLTHGPDFWRAADEASAWLEGRGGAVQELRRDIAAARFGGGARDEEGVRRRLVERLGRAMPPERSPWGFRAAALALVAGAAVVVVAAGPHAGDEAAALRAARADAWAHAGDVARARDEWRRLWTEGAHPAALAARLSWAEVRDGAVAPASAWVLRGERGEPRDAALAWVRERVREGGGLMGASRAHLPVRSLEWALLALALGVAAGAAWPRRGPAAALLALALLAVAVRPVEDAWAHRPQAVVRRAVTLEGAGVSLDAGQVVAVRGRDGARVRVVAGRGLAGWAAADALEPIEEGR